LIELSNKLILYIQVNSTVVGSYVVLYKKQQN